MHVLSANLPIEQMNVDETVNVTLAQTIQAISESVNWSKAVYAGMFFGEKTEADMETLIDNYATNGDWLNVLKWSVICKKLEIEREEAIRAALDGLPTVGPLPWTRRYGEVDYFCVEDKYALFCYYYAEKYQYRLDKWNKTNGYNFFKTAIYNNGRPALFVNANGGTLTISYGPRYYDESASTIQCFLVFYEFGIMEALNDALYWWNWINNNLWYQNTHYKYALNWDDYECEAGFFAKIVSNLKYYENDLGNWSRIFIDLQNRFLVDKWNSKQWFSQSENTTTYVVIHHYPSNSQRRLQNTIGAWTTLLALYNMLENGSQYSLQEMLRGYGGLNPAWKLLESPEARLYDNVSGKFKWSSDGTVSDEATAYVSTLMLFLGIVPKTTTIIFPLEEYSYEYFFDIDPKLYSLNFNTTTLRVTVAADGQLEFIYGVVPVLCEFPSSGTYEIQFSNDWNSILNVSKLQELPTNRKFLGFIHDIAVMDVAPSKTLIECGETVDVNVTIVNQGDFTETFNVTFYANSTAVETKMIENLTQGTFETITFLWNTTSFQRDKYVVSVYTTPVYGESNLINNIFTCGVVIIGVHDIAIQNISFSTYTPTVNETLIIYVKLQNKGDFNETFTLYLNYTLIIDPPIGNLTVILASGKTVTLNFTWIPNFIGSCKIEAYTSEIPGDICLNDNSLIAYIYVDAKTWRQSMSFNSYFIMLQSNSRYMLQTNFKPL
ncbi:MAG: CARDB domain-containing protein [Candidatus Bathyarchaeales archaeon]